MGRRIGIICNCIREAVEYIKEVNIPQSEAFIIYKVDHLRCIRNSSLDFVITISENSKIEKHIKTMDCSSIKEYLTKYA
jgi:hypothetical protein